MQHKILIVDDENKSRELLTIFVRKNIPNAVIDAVDHPHVALQMLRESKYNLLLLDYEMPLMNGFEVLKEIQQMGHVPHIMLVSAYRDFDFAHKGIEIGVLEYIVKPIDNRQIEKAIKKYKRFFPDKKIEKVALPAYNGDHFVDIENIGFIEKAARNKLSIQLSDGSQVYINGLLSEWEKLLTDNYVYISRKCIINKDLVKIINTKSQEIRIQTAAGTYILHCSRNRIRQLVELHKDLQ